MGQTRAYSKRRAPLFENVIYVSMINVCISVAIANKTVKRALRNRYPEFKKLRAPGRTDLKSGSKRDLRAHNDGSPPWFMIFS